ncbi:hypothetical protein Tco_0474351 [Tanacetum coccineum]
MIGRAILAVGSHHISHGLPAWQSVIETACASFESDTLMASSPKVDYTLDEFAGELKTISPGIVNRENEEYISLLERLLYDNSSLRPLEDFHVNPNTIIESLPIASPLKKIVNLLRKEIDIFPRKKIENKIYDPGICIEVEATRFLSTLSPVIDTLLPFSSENEDKVFNHGVLASKEKSPPSYTLGLFKALSSSFLKDDKYSWRAQLLIWECSSISISIP